MEQFYVVIVVLAMTNSLAIALEPSEIEKESLKQNQAPAVSLLGTNLPKSEVQSVGLLEKINNFRKSNNSKIHRYDRSAAVFSGGNLPDDTFPITDLLTYGVYCDVPGYDLYSFTGVSDAFKCGAQYCAGEKKCTHFAYNIRDKTCWLKSRPGSGSNWVEKSTDLHCGLVPFRACPINTATVSSLLYCLTLNV